MTTTIYSQISRNKRNTWLIIISFIIFVSFLGWFTGQVFFEGSGTFFVLLALIFSGFSCLVSYFESDKIILAVSGAREVAIEENKYLHNLVENLCIGAGLPKPRIYIINDTSMNAFATGRDPSHSIICFTSGIVEKLTKLELEGVIAHELSHIGNYDIGLMSIVTVLVGTVVLISDWVTRGMFYGGRRKSASSNSEISGILMIVGLVLLILSPIIATLMQLAISRDREYLADSSAALLTRYPDGLASALKKLSQDTEILEAANRATSHLYIANPIKSENRGFLASIYDTHPPISERIKRLEEM